MDEEIKQKWLAALRSGEYEQGTDQLRDGNKFCCLGVLCDVYDSGLWDGEAYMGVDDLLPSDIAELIGFNSDSPEIDYDGVSVPIIELNDGAYSVWDDENMIDIDIQLSFEELADLIEAQL